MSIDSHLSELVRRHQAIEEAILAEINRPTTTRTSGGAMNLRQSEGRAP